MKIKKSDWLFIGLIVVVVSIFFAISGNIKTKFVPFDEQHKPFYETYAKTGDKKAAEKGCESCHNEKEKPLPANHPPKYRCLLCHKLKSK